MYYSRHIYIKKVTFLHLKFKFNWDSFILFDKPNLYANSNMNVKLEPKEGLGDT